MPRPNTSRGFCCYFEATTGIYVLATLCLVGGGLLGAGAWLSLIPGNIQKFFPDSQPVMTDGQKALLILNGIVWSVLPLISVFGIIGTVLRRRRLVKIYSVALWSHVFPMLILPFLLVWSFDSRTFYPCIVDPHTPDELHLCQGNVYLGRGIAALVLFILFVIEIYNAIIAQRFATGLLYEKHPSEPFMLAQLHTPTNKSFPGGDSEYHNSDYLPSLPYATTAYEAHQPLYDDAGKGEELYQNRGMSISDQKRPSHSPGVSGSYDHHDGDDDDEYNDDEHDHHDEDHDDTFMPPSYADTGLGDPSFGYTDAGLTEKNGFPAEKGVPPDVAD